MIEDLLDIRIFSSMNSVIKDKIRLVKEDVKVLELKKESLIDKVNMQENFIDELENRGKKNIEDKESKIGKLLVEENNWMGDNEEKNRELVDLQGKLEEYTVLPKNFVNLATSKVRFPTKYQALRKNIKFFSQNTVCPTCGQGIEESFRINRITDAQDKAKELQSGYTELEQAINKEEERERQFTTLSKEITTLTHGISQNNIKIAGCQRQVRDLESEIQRITDNLANRNTEHEKLTTFKENLKTTYDELAQRKDTINYYDFFV